MARSNNMTLPREDFAEAATLAEGAEESPPFYLYGQVLDDVSFVQDRYERAQETDALSPALGIIVGTTVSVLLWAVIIAFMWGPFVR
jgi:hypothetical protein